MPNSTSFAQYLECVGTGAQRARTPWTADLDGYTSGFFLAARLGSDDVRGFGDEQTLASMWRGATAAERTFHWYIEDHATEGHLILTWEDSLGAIATETSLDMVDAQFVNDTTVAWLGVSVRFDGGGAHTQWYFGEYGRRPVWSLWGTESTDAGVIDMLTDPANDLTLGDSQYLTGAQDQLDGHIMEYFQFSNDFPNMTGNLVAHFNGDDFTAGDGDTDTARDSTGRVWTLAGAASNIIPPPPLPINVFIGGFDWPNFPSAIVINLGGVGWDWAVATGSMTIDYRIGERSVAALAAWDIGQGLGTQLAALEGFPAKIIGPDNLTAFDGWIRKPKALQTNPFSSEVLWDFSLIDNHYLADKRLIIDGWIGQTAGFIVQSIIDQVLVEEQVVAGTIEAGPILTEVVFNYITCARALDRLAEMAGKTWWIDGDKKLHFIAPSGAPVLTVDNDDMIDAPDVSFESPDYRNVQYVRGVKGYTDAQTEDFEGDGTLQSFVTSYPIGKVPTVTLNAGGQTVGIRGLDTGKDWYWSKGSNVLSQETTDTPIVSTDALQIVYEGLFELVAKATDEAEVIRFGGLEGGPGLTGLVESVIQVTDIFGRGAAFDEAAGLLTTYAQEGSSITFSTERSDYKVGDFVTVNLVWNGPLISGEIYLVSAVTARDKTATEWVYDVTIIQGADAGSWQRRLAQGMVDAEVLVIRENISEEEVLTILDQTSETWGWAETDVTVSVAACPIPSTTLNPSTTLLPC